MRCGELCKTCTRQCRDIPSEGQSIEIECLSCGGIGKELGGKLCEDCNGDGHFLLTECPRSFVDAELTEILNIASFASKGIMPNEGGLMNQSKWFMHMWQTLENEQSRIDIERSNK